MENAHSRRGLSTLSRAHYFHGTIDLRQNPFALRQKHGSGFRQRHGLPCTVQKLRPDAPFKVLDLPAQRRLRYIQRLRRPAKMKFLGDCDKISQMPEFETNVPWR
jgi:hypothetical protein